MTAEDDRDSHLRSELSRKAAIEKFRNRPESETGWDRLREFYTIRHIEWFDFECSPELEIVGDLFKLSTLLGFCTGFMNHWKESRETFIRLNKANKFIDQKSFMKEAYQHQIKFSGRHGIRLGLRLGFFTGLYSLTMTSLAMYNNTLGVKEYAISGLVSGALWQARVGIPGIIMGGTMGGFLGLLGGFGASAVMKYENTDFANLRYDIHLSRQKEWEKRREMETKVLVDELIRDAKKELQESNQA